MLFDVWFADSVSNDRAFQLVIILQEIAFASDTARTNAEETVNLEPGHAIVDMESFLPGVSASILAFIVFGTTKAFRDFFYVKLVPRCIRRKIRARCKRPSVANAAVLPTAQPRNPVRRESEIPGGPMSPDAGGPLSGRSECYELDGGEVGQHPGTGMVYELATPTPTHSTFELQKKGEEEDKWPILSIRPHRR